MARKTVVVKISYEEELIGYSDIENALEKLDIDDYDLLEEYDD